MSASSSVYDFFYNAATGNLAPDQQSGLISDETSSLIAAGENPATAAQQAQNDVLNLSQTGLPPTVGQQIGTFFKSNWIWFLLAGVFILAFLFR